MPICTCLGQYGTNVLEVIAKYSKALQGLISVIERLGSHIALLILYVICMSHFRAPGGPCKSIAEP